MTIWYAQNSSVDIDSLLQWNDDPAGNGTPLVWAALGATDVLCANGQTDVNINVNVTCARISTAAEGAGAAGGGFIVGAAVTITADVVAGTSTCISVSGDAYTLTIVGDIDGGSERDCEGILVEGTCDLEITGGVTGGAGSDAYGVLFGSTGDCLITGAVTGGSAGHAVVNNESGSVVIVGNVAGGSFGAGVLNSVGGSVEITGDVTGGTDNGGYGAENVAAGDMTIVGNVTGGAGFNAHGVMNGDVGTVSIVGDVTGGSAVGAYGVHGYGAGVVTISHGNLINTATSSAAVGPIVYDPDESGLNYIQYPGPICFYRQIDEAALAAAVWAYGNRTLTP